MMCGCGDQPKHHLQHRPTFVEIFFHPGKTKIRTQQLVYLKKVHPSATTMASDTPPNLLYLPKSAWSPRYDATFFSVVLEGKELVKTMADLSEKEETEVVVGVAPPRGRRRKIPGKTNLPAYYYRVTVYRERDKKVCWRRYSHFKWLHEQWLMHPPPSSVLVSSSDSGNLSNAAAAAEAPLPPLQFPPGTCLGLFPQTDGFAQLRQQHLGEYLDDALCRPGYACHPATRTFLELDS